MESFLRNRFKEVTRHGPHHTAFPDAVDTGAFRPTAAVDIFAEPCKWDSLSKAMPPDAALFETRFQ